LRDSLARGPARPAGWSNGRHRRPASTAGFLRRCLEVLSDRDPPSYDQVRRHLIGTPAQYLVGTERFTVQVRGDRVLVRPGTAAATRIDVETSASDIVHLLDGTSSMAELVDRDLLRIRADADSLLDLSAAVRAFSDAAVGSPPLQQIFESYRAWVLRHGTGR